MVECHHEITHKPWVYEEFYCIKCGKTFGSISYIEWLEHELETLKESLNSPYKDS